MSWPKGPECLGYRLPTEAEWEVSARGGRGAKYVGGNEPGAVDSFEGSAGRKTESVGQDVPNGYGVQELNGRLWVWWDWFASTAYAGRDGLGAVGWYDGNSGSTTHRVGQKVANGYGLHDLSGNVREWVWDGYDRSAYAAGSVIDPLGPSQWSFRVNRGGGWSNVPAGVRVVKRSYYTPSLRVSDLGLRLLRTAD